MITPKKRTSIQTRGGLSGYVSRKLASWVWYDTHIPLTPMAHHPRLAPIENDPTFEFRGTS